MPIHTKRKLICYLLFLVGLNAASLSNCFAAVVGATENQNGFRIVGGSDSAVKIGTFDFPQGYSNFTDIRLRLWVDLAGTVLNANSPQLFFRPYSPILDGLAFSFGPPPVQPPFSFPIPTDVRVTNNTGIPTYAVDERQGDWVPLSVQQGNTLASIINAEPLGRVDFWLYSPATRDLAVPSKSTTFSFTSFQFVEFIHTATIELRSLEAIVPEPASSIVFLGSIAAFFCARRLIVRE